MDAMRNSLVVIGLVFLSMDLPLSGASCSQEDLARLNKIEDRWRWETFWKEGFENNSYVAGKRILIAMFWNERRLGYCSVDLDACALYAVTDSNLREMVDWSSSLARDDLGD